jgi:anhydro-N-acetylmuramic acid kinase
VEAAAFAGSRTSFEGRPGNLTAVTGARGPRVLGALYPGGVTKP